MKPQLTVHRLLEDTSASAPVILVSNVGMLEGAVEKLLLQKGGEGAGDYVFRTKQNQIKTKTTHTKQQEVSSEPILWNPLED